MTALYWRRIAAVMGAITIAYAIFLMFVNGVFL